MKRTALELSKQFRDAVASQSEDDYARLLEDINDSVGDVDMQSYVEKSEYDKVVAERDANAAKAQDYRDRYINRFYQPGTKPNDQTYIVGDANQATIEKDEYDVSYDELFE